MKETVEAIKAAGLRDKVKIMIGGGQVSEEIRKYAGADAYGTDAMAGVSFAKEWTKVKIIDPSLQDHDIFQWSRFDLDQVIKIYGKRNSWQTFP